MKKVKLIGLLLCVVLACVGVFALTGCGGNGNGGSNAEQQVLTSLEGTSWQIEKVSIDGTEKTLADYAKESGFTGTLRMYCEFAKDTVVFHTERDGKDNTNTNKYTYENGSFTLLDATDKSGANIKGTVEGSTMKMTWDNNYYLLSKI